MVQQQDLDDFERAKAVAPYGDDTKVGKLTAAVAAQGHQILQIHRLANDDREHCQQLLALFAPPEGAVVLDAGCGTGAVAAHMRALRPDLEFILLNVSAAQLAMVPPGFRKVRGDFHTIPLPAEAVDAVMYLYSLGHGLLERAIAEAERVLRPGGILFIYDISSKRPEVQIEQLGYKPHPVTQLVHIAQERGFEKAPAAPPAAVTRTAFDALFPEAASALDGTFPIALRFLKC